MPVYEAHRILRIMKWPVDLGAEVVGTDSSLYMTSLCCPELGVTLADRMTISKLLLPSRMVEDGHGVWHQTDHSVRP